MHRLLADDNTINSTSDRVRVPLGLLSLDFGSSLKIGKKKSDSNNEENFNNVGH